MLKWPGRQRRGRDEAFFGSVFVTGPAALSAGVCGLALPSVACKVAFPDPQMALYSTWHARSQNDSHLASGPVGCTLAVMPPRCSLSPAPVRLLGDAAFLSLALSCSYRPPSPRVRHSD